MTRLQIIFILWLAWGSLSLAALIFILARPKTWASWIEKENSFWVRRGRFSSVFAEKMKKLETGTTMKLLLGANVLFSAAVLYMVFHLAAQRPFRALLPPQPVPILRRQLPH
jgi:hypothetical protein